jgi:hypothetical protein
MQKLIDAIALAVRGIMSRTPTFDAALSRARSRARARATRAGEAIYIFRRPADYPAFLLMTETDAINADMPAESALFTVQPDC